MAKLKVPTLQHLARCWRENPFQVQKGLVNLVLNPPTFNYNPLYGAVRDLLVLGVPYEQVEKGIQRIARDGVRKILLEVLPLIRDHFSGVEADFVQGVARRYYPAGRGLMIPFDPPLIFGVGGKIYFPWFSFWRGNPLKDEKLSLFVTLVEEMLLQDPDLESAEFQILDFSAPGPKHNRALKVIDAALIPRVTEERKREMLEIFAEGYFLAKAHLDALAAAADLDPKEPRPGDPDQPDLF